MPISLSPFVFRPISPRDSSEPVSAQQLCASQSMTEKPTAQTGPAPDQNTSNGTAENTTPSKMVDGSTVGKADSNAKDNAQTSPASKPEGAAGGARTSPKKRRKVNHGKNSHPSRATAAVPYVCLSLLWLLDHVANQGTTLAACVYCRRSVSSLPRGEDGVYLLHHSLHFLQPSTPSIIGTRKRNTGSGVSSLPPARSSLEFIC